MTMDSISRPQSTSAERFQRVVLPATVELIKSAIANSVVTADNAPFVVENIANAVAGLSSKQGVHDQEDFSDRGIDLSGVPLDLQQVVKNFQKSYLSSGLNDFQPQTVAAPVKRKVGRPKKLEAQSAVSQPVAAVRQPPTVSAPASRIASPTRQGTIPVVASSSPAPVVRPVQELSVPSLRVDMKRRAADTEPKTKSLEKRIEAPPESTRKLPKGLGSINEAVTDEYIVCLDDGRKVKDLEKHLDSKGVAMEAYLKKWGLPSGYPTRAPKLILSKGTVYEYDIHLDKFVAS